MSDKTDQEAAEEYLNLVVAEPVGADDFAARSILLAWYLRCMGSVVIAPRPRGVLAASLVEMLGIEIDHSAVGKISSRVLTPFLSIARDNFEPVTAVLLDVLENDLLGDAVSKRRVAALTLLFLTYFCARARSDESHLVYVEGATDTVVRKDLEALKEIGQSDELVAFGLCARGLLSMADFCNSHSLPAMFYIRLVVERGDSSTFISRSLAEYAVFGLLRAPWDEGPADRTMFAELAVVLDQQIRTWSAMARPLLGHAGSEQQFISPWGYPGTFKLTDDVNLSQEELFALWFCLALWRGENLSHLGALDLGRRQWLVESLEGTPTEEEATQISEQLSASPDVRTLIVDRLLGRRSLRSILRVD